MHEKLYAVFVEEPGDKERLAWDAGYQSEGRRFFFGGNAITALIFTHANTAHAFVKRNGVLEDFKEGTQYYVRTVQLTPF